VGAQSRTGLIADIGGTNARFALVGGGGEVFASERVRTGDFPGPVEAARTVISRHAPDNPPRLGAFAVAGPVSGDTVALTNSPWEFSIKAVQAALGLDTLRVINDFAANALAIPALTDDDWTGVGADRTDERPNAPVAAIGPGTGLGVALLLPDGNGDWRAQATEGGHVTLAAADADEARVIARVWKNHDHVSAERLVCGPGLVLLHQTLRDLELARGAALDSAEAITAAAARGDDPLAARAVSMMFAMLGTVAGNLVLSTGALGGVYILGGIVPANLALFLASSFRDRFEAKGRFRDYLSAVPTRVVTHPNPAFVGLARMLRRELR
jgi:glucokinase